MVSSLSCEALYSNVPKGLQIKLPPQNFISASNPTRFTLTPGDTGYRIFETKFAKIGVLICWDQWYPEAARITALMGAEILFYPTAIGWANTQEEPTNIEQYNAWQTIQRSHAVANGVPVVSVNRVFVCIVI